MSPFIRTGVFLAVLAIEAMSGMARAQPWPQGKGQGYVNLSFTYLRYTEIIDRFKPKTLWQNHAIKRAVSDHTLNGYIEYGVTDRLTAIGNIPYKFLKTGDHLRPAPDDRYPGDTVAAGSRNGTSNIDIGGRYLLSEGALLWSVQLITGLNSAFYDHPTGLRSGYDTWYVTPRIQTGKGWGKTYFSASLGYRHKSNGYASDLISDNEFGYKWQRSGEKKTWFIFTMGAEIPVTTGNYDDRNSVHTGLYRDEEGFVDPGLKINHYFNEHLALNLSSVGALWTWHGGNSLTYTAGVAYEW